jgi:hypothetical protein
MLQKDSLVVLRTTSYGSNFLVHHQSGKEDS